MLAKFIKEIAALLTRFCRDMSTQRFLIGRRGNIMVGILIVSVFSMLFLPGCRGTTEPVQPGALVPVASALPGTLNSPVPMTPSIRETTTKTAPGTPVVQDITSPDQVPIVENRPPVLESIGDRVVSQGKSIEIFVKATDPDGDRLTYTATNLPENAYFNRTTAVFSFTPGYSGLYPDISFSVTDGQLATTQTINITVLPVISPLLQEPADDILPLTIFYYGHPTESIERNIVDLRPQYFIINTSQGLWGRMGGHDWNVFGDTSAFKSVGIKIIGYITAGYEGTRSGGDIDSLWYSLEMNEKLIKDMAEIDRVDGIFIDECSNFPDKNSKAYLKTLTDLAHSYGLITWGNVGTNDFDPWFFTEGGFDLVHSTENWRGQKLTKVQRDWGSRISVTGFNEKYTAKDAIDLTVNGWRKGLAYSYITNTSLGYDELPVWIEEYARLLRQYRLHPELYQPPPEVGNTTGVVADLPVPSGAHDEYNFTLTIISTTVDGLKPGQKIWVVSTTGEFPDLLTVGSTLTGDLDNSIGWWIFKGTGGY